MATIVYHDQTGAGDQSDNFRVELDWRQCILTAAHDQRWTTNVRQARAAVRSSHDCFLLTQKRVVADAVRHLRDVLDKRRIGQPAFMDKKR